MGRDGHGNAGVTTETEEGRGMANRNYDVVIVGAGFAGLAAADRLNTLNADRARQGRMPISYVVLEGAACAGGRTRTKTEHYLDFGGQYLAPRFIDPAINGYRQEAVWSLVDRFGIEVFDTHLPSDRDHVYLSADGERGVFRGNYPNEGQGEVGKFVDMLEKIVADMRPFVGRPWEFPNAERFDAVSVEQWMAETIQDPAMVELFTIAIRSAFSVEPAQCSLLHLLHYAASCGSFSAFEHVDGGGDAVRFRFGTADLIHRLEESVGENRLRYGLPVTSIRQNLLGCEVITKDLAGAETVWGARQVIVAMSPSASSGIRFEPELPETRRALVAGMPMARTIKGFAIFERPWWRDKFSGYALSAQEPLDWVMDNTWVDSNGELGAASLMTFIVGDAALRWGNGKSTPEQRQEAVLSQLATMFDYPLRDLKAELKRYVDFDWGSDEWGRGCPAGCLSAGVLTGTVGGQRIGEALYRPVGRIHWGGSETGLRWMGGYMNGAIDSGVRVADEVAALL
jgi:monoamine oxidase